MKGRWIKGIALAWLGITIGALFALFLILSGSSPSRADNLPQPGLRGSQSTVAQKTGTHKSLSELIPGAGTHFDRSMVGKLYSSIVRRSPGGERIVQSPSPGHAFTFTDTGQPYEVATLAGCYECGPAYLSFDTSGNLYVTATVVGAGNTGVYNAAPPELTTGGFTSLTTNEYGSALVTQGGLNIWDLMSQTGLPAGTIAVSGTCYNIKATPGVPEKLWIAGSSAAITFTVVLFDDAATTCSTTGASNTSYPIWESGTTIGAGQVILIDIPDTINGLAYTITGTITKTTPIFLGWY